MPYIGGKLYTNQDENISPNIMFSLIRVVPEGRFDCFKLHITHLPHRDVFCHGPLLDMVQRSGIYKDSKTFVDMYMMEDPDTVLREFHLMLQQGVPTTNKLQSFIAKYFSNPGSEMENYVPHDWTARYLWCWHFHSARWVYLDTLLMIIDVFIIRHCYLNSRWVYLDTLI